MRKRKNNYFPLAFILFFICANLFAQEELSWKEISPFYGEKVKVMKRHPDGRIFLGTLYGKIYVSDNNGENWKLYDRVSSEKEIVGIVFDKDGIVYYADRTAFWNTNPQNDIDEIVTDFSSDSIFSLAIDDDDNLFLGCRSGLYESKDKGRTWTKLFNSFDVGFISIKRDIICAGINQLGVNLSFDKGKTWNMKRLPQGDFWSICIVDENIFYVAISHPLTGSNLPFTNYQNGLFKTTDGGESWENLINKFSTDYLTSIYLDGNNVLYVGGNIGRLYKSIDNGNNWELLTSGKVSNTINSIIMDKDNILLGTTHGGVLKSSDEGKTWKFSNNGFDKLKVRAIQAVGDSSLIIANCAGAFFYNAKTDSYEGINGFQEVKGLNASSIDGEIMDLIPVDKNSIIASTYQGKILKSDDLGKNWYSLDLPFSSAMIVSLKRYQDGNFILCANGSDGGIFCSKDNCVTWEKFLGFNKVYTNINFLVGSDDKYYLSRENYLSISEDEGLSWGNSIKFVGTINYINELSGRTILLTSYGIVISEDNFKTWYTFYPKDYINSYYQVVSTNSVVKMSSGRLICASDKGVYISEDKGMNWIKSNDKLSNLCIDDFYLDSDNNLYAQTDNGLFSLLLNENKQTTNIRIENLADSYKLFDNYPNPFNPTTTISYQLPEAGMVTLKVYDMLGKEVATLVNEVKQAGYYKATFDASKLASGIYISTIKTNNYTQSKKMLLVK